MYREIIITLRNVSVEILVISGLAATYMAASAASAPAAGHHVPADVSSSNDEQPGGCWR